MIWLWHVLAAGFAALMVLSLTRPLSWLAHQYGWVYTHPPTARDVIVADVPFVGGLVALVGLFAANLISPWPHTAWGVTLGMFIIIVFGLMADLAVLPRWHRLAVLLAASLASVIGSQALIDSTGPILGPIELSMSWIAIPLSALFVMMIAVGFRRVDRADGLCDGLALVTALGVLAIVALRAADGAPIDQVSGLGSVALAVIGSLSALAFFTWRRKLRRVASVYLSNAGSSMLGLVSAWLLLQAQGGLGEASIGPGALLWLVSIPVADLLFFALRVVFTGAPDLVQDRSRLHHLLQARHFTMAQAMWIQLGVAVALTVAALVSWRIGMPDSLMFYGWLAGFATYAYAAMAFWESGARAEPVVAPTALPVSTPLTGQVSESASQWRVRPSSGPNLTWSDRTSLPLPRHSPDTVAARNDPMQPGTAPLPPLKPTWHTVAELQAMGRAEYDPARYSAQDEARSATLGDDPAQACPGR